MKPEPIIAEYKPAALAAFRGNPFIEVLPTVKDDGELARLLEHKPPYDPLDRHAPTSLRRESLVTLQNLFIPLPCHMELAWTLMRTIRQGYLNRNPADPKHLAKIRGAREAMTSQLPAWRNVAAPTGFSVIGVSGIGKTTAVNRVLNLFPQLIRHTEYQGQPLPAQQAVWIKLDLPFDCSVKGLVAKFLAKADELLGTEFHRMCLHSRSTVDILMPDMATAAAMCGLGLLVIDEVQHLQAAKSGGAAKMLNFFVELSNTMNIPVALVGTPQALEPLSIEFRSARRAAAQGTLFWDRMPRNDGVFEHFLRQLWQYQYTAAETRLTPDLADVLYEESQGITSVLVSLYQLTQDALIGTGGGEIITAEAVRDTANKFFKPLAPFLKALRDGTSAASLGDLNFNPADVLADQQIPAVPASMPPPPDKTCEAAEPKTETPKKRGRKPKSNLFREAERTGQDPYEMLKDKGVVRGLEDILKG